MIVRRGAYPTLLIALVLALAACAPTVLDRAKQSASISFDVYESLSDQVVTDIGAIVAKDSAGTITDDDRARLQELDALRAVLDDYAATHNLYVEALRTWELNQTAPDTTITLESQMYRLIYRGIDLAVELGLNVPASVGL